MASQKAANLAKIAPDKREQLLVIATKRSDVVLVQAQGIDSCQTHQA
jgi:hypothetical protein